jgi:hypothetical protein
MWPVFQYQSKLILNVQNCGRLQFFLFLTTGTHARRTSSKFEQRGQGFGPTCKCSRAALVAACTARQTAAVSLVTSERERESRLACSLFCHCTCSIPPPPLSKIVSGPTRRISVSFKKSLSTVDDRLKVMSPILFFSDLKNTGRGIRCPSLWFYLHPRTRIRLLNSTNVWT